MAPIEIDSLCLSFGDRPVLDGFSMRVEVGETVVLAGESGSGKSSVLSCIMGFLRPDSGRILVRGEILGPKSVWHLRRSMALVQQEPDLGDERVDAWLRDPFSFRANASLRPNLANLPSLLDLLRLPPSILSQKGPDLSGGEKQRVALVAALLLDRPILLLDEHASALDPDSRRAVYSCLSGLSGISILMVSHDSESALDFAHRSVRLPSRKAPHGRA